MSSPRPVALSGCALKRPLRNIELAIAEPADRTFPARESDTLGICLKRGAAHEVCADGRTLIYPADALAIRTPGCLWSSARTGVASFVSLDIGRTFLPESLRLCGMVFMPESALPGFACLVRSLGAMVRPRAIEEAVANLVVELHGLGVLRAPELDAPAARSTVRLARSRLVDQIEKLPTLDRLAEQVGQNKFVLLRQFKRELGVTPRAYAVSLRIGRAREDLARGVPAAEVAACWGFADQSHLTRQFRAVLGLTPAEYARQVRVQVPVTRST